MDDIKIKRGGKSLTFKKMKKYFAVRLKQGRARCKASLESACGEPNSDVEHVGSASTENLEIFAVAAPEKLEKTMDSLRKSSASEVVTHMYSLDGTPEGAVIPTGTMTVQFSPDTEKKKREEILAEHGLEIVEELDYLPHGYTVRLTSASKENPLKIAAKLQKREEIVTAEPDLSFKVALKRKPTDTLYYRQWHLNNRGGETGLVEGADVRAESAWDYTMGSREITICVIDDGFDLTHPEFDVPGKINAPRDFGQDDFDPNPGFEDDNHGTACAGVALAECNERGVVGLAPGCSFMPVRMAFWLSDDSIVDMFKYAKDNNADVISCSWSASGTNFPLSTKMNAIIHKAATEGRANGKGCVILFAAGNEESPLNDTKDGVEYHQGFALHPDVIAVGASNSLDRHSSYSNYGPELSICAPSNGMPGRSIVTTDRRGTRGYSSGDYTYDFGGTSSSTPLVAGLAGLILSVNPDLTSAEVKSIIMNTADKIDQENGQYVDGHSPLYGYGRINAYEAVKFAAGHGIEKPSEVMAVEHRVSKTIPDEDTIQDEIVFPIEVPIKAVEVGVDIKHTWSGDLTLTLKAPDASEVVLQDKVGGSNQDIIKNFRSSDAPDLFAPVLKSPAKGSWQLKIKDNADEDEGILRKWSVAITY